MFLTEVFFCMEGKNAVKHTKLLNTSTFFPPCEKKSLRIFHKVDIQTIISAEDSNHNKKHKNYKFNH